MRGWRLLMYVAGVAAAGACGFLSPWPWTGFAPLAAGLVWGAYDVYDDGEELVDGNAPSTAPR